MDDDASGCGDREMQRRASGWIGPRLASWLVMWRSSLSVMIAGGLAAMALSIGMAYRGPLHPTGTTAPDEVAAVVFAERPVAASIRYAHYWQGPGIPDPSAPDAAAVEFREAGVVCTGRVDGLTSDHRTLSDVECGNEGLQAREARFIHPGWALGAGALAVVSGVLAIRTRYRCAPTWTT